MPSITLGIFFFVDLAFGWQMNPPPLAEDTLSLSDATFIGKVIHVEKLPDDPTQRSELFPEGSPDVCEKREKVEFTILREWKASLRNESANHHYLVWNCAGKFKMGEEYLVFAVEKDGRLQAPEALPGNFGSLTALKHNSGEAIQRLSNLKDVLEKQILLLGIPEKIPHEGVYHWVANLDHDFGLDKILRLQDPNGKNVFYYIKQPAWEKAKFEKLFEERQAHRFCGKVVIPNVTGDSIEIFFDKNKAGAGHSVECSCSVFFRYVEGRFHIKDSCEK